MTIRFIEEEPKTIRFLDEGAESPVVRDDFIGRMGADIKSRIGQVGEISQRQEHLGQGVGSSVLQGAGVAVGTAGDVLGNAAISGFRALPDAIETPIRQGASDLGSYLAQTGVGQTAINAIQGGSGAYNEWKQNNPIEAANLEAVVNIAEVLPIAKPAAIAGKALAKTGFELGGEAVNTAGRLASRGLSKVDDAVQPLAKRALDFDIPLRFDQIKPSQLAKTTQKVSQSVPLSGTAKFESLQKTAWNEALAKTLGVDDLQPKSIKAFRATNSSMFDDVLSQKNIIVSADDIAKIDGYRSAMDDMHGLTSRDISIVNKNIDNIVNTVAVGDNQGQKFAALRSSLLDKADKAGDSSPAYYDLVDVIDDITQRSMTPDDIAKLAKARKQYKHYKTIQKTLGGEPLGEVNPTKLMGKVSASKYIDPTVLDIGDDDLVDLARIGKEFLAKQGGSDTFGNVIAASSLPAGVVGGATIGAGATGAIAGGVIGGNRLLQSGVLRNQGLINQLVERSPVFKKPSLPSAAEFAKMSPKEYAALLAMSGVLATKQEEQQQ